VDFNYLFSPLKIGPVTVPNRVVFPAHMTMFSRDGMPSDRLCYYYAERAKGGAGLIVTEIAAVHPTTQKYPECVRAYDERCIPGYSKMVKLVHDYGGKAFVQLAHSGARMSSEDSLLPLWAPSTVISPIANEIPHEMDNYDIADLLEGYAVSARNAGRAGFDGVEIHAAHEYLLGSFMSPLTNKRTDQYGGTLENRLRLASEVIVRIRENFGRDFTLGLRINGDDLLDGGLEPDDAREIAAAMASKGQIDYISVSAGTSFNTHMNVPPMYVPLGAYSALAANVREAVSIPVVAVGRINDPVQAEKILAEGQADMVAMARALICDPEWVNKTKQGRIEDIRKCIACNEGCIGRLFKTRSISCVQNPTVGLEHEISMDSINPAATRKKIVVVGGGPAGMEASRVAAMRGHRVILYEKQDRLGGQILLAAKAPYRLEFGDIARFLTAQVEKLGIQVRLGKEVELDDIKEQNPDVVIVATGSVPLDAQFPGADEEIVVNYWQVLNEEVPIGEKIVLVDDTGHYQAYGTAEFLANRGKKVEIVTSSLSAGAALDLTNIIPIYERLLPKGVVITPITKLRRVSGKDVLVYNVFTGEERKIENVDNVVTAIGNRADTQLFYALKQSGERVHAIGDCLAPRNALRAIRDGHLLARDL